MAPRMVAEKDAGALSGVYGEIRSSLGLGIVPNVFKAMAAVNHDVLMQNWTAFRQTFLEGVLPRPLKEMVALVVSRENRNAYGVKLHGRCLSHLGVPLGVVRSLSDTGDAPDLAPLVRTVLGIARKYGHNPDGMHVETLEAAGLSEDDAQEVIDTVLIACGMAQFADECGLPCDGD